MESEAVNDKLNSTSGTSNLQQTESRKDSTEDHPKAEKEFPESKDSVSDTWDAGEDVQERLSEKESLVLPSLDSLKADLRASQDSLDKVEESAEGEDIPVVSKDTVNLDDTNSFTPIGTEDTNTFIPIGAENLNNEHERFYLNPDANQDLSDSGSYTDSLEPDDNIPHIHLLPKRDTNTSDQPEADQAVEPETNPIKRKRRKKSRLPVPTGMATVQKNSASKEKNTSKEKTSKDKAVSKDEVTQKAENTPETTKNQAETETKPIQDGVESLNEQLANGGPVKDSENGDSAKKEEKSIENIPEANGIGSEKSSEKLSQTCDPETRHAETPKAEKTHKSNSTPKCQRSQSIDEKGSGSKHSSRSSIHRRETIDMGDTKPVCAALGDTKPTCAARALKETKMDLYMNSNEGFLIPHQHQHQQLSPAGAPVLRDTIASRLRIEKAHNEHLEPEKSPLDYLTPFQRKEHAIKELKLQMRNLNEVLEHKNSEIAQLREGLGKETQDLLKAKDDQFTEVQKQLNEMGSKYENLKRSYEESVKTVTNLEATVKDLKDSIAEHKRKSDSLYLEMYLKGQDAARYEREEEIEQMAGSVDDKVFKKTSTTPDVNTKELLAKLNRTQAELAKWQSLRREEAYHEVDKPETEAEATLRFLRDSFFHYITDQKIQDDHMRAMIQIFNYTEVQKKKITKALLEKKAKKT